MVAKKLEPPSIHGDSESEQTIKVQVLQIITLGKINASTGPRLLKAAVMLARMRSVVE